MLQKDKAEMEFKSSALEFPPPPTGSKIDYDYSSQDPLSYSIFDKPLGDAVGGNIHQSKEVSTEKPESLQNIYSNPIHCDVDIYSGG
jgi:hypothetical protein